MTQPTDIRRALLPGAPAPSGMRFYLTTHKRHWLRWTDVPLFLKSEHFDRAVKWDEARGPYAIDSGGFMELKGKGTWTRTPRQYVRDLRRIWEHVGPYDWAAPQDWMCEKAIIEGGWFGGQYFVGTHLSVEEHQHRTVQNFLELRSLAPDLRIAPVVQGDSIPAYEHCLDLYDKAGVDLRAEPVVGLGSVCRLQSTRQGAASSPPWPHTACGCTASASRFSAWNASGTCWPPRTPPPGAPTPAIGPPCPATPTRTAPTASTTPSTGANASSTPSPLTSR
nr:hypothetical protein [Streptomyces sp. HF10]